MRADPAGVMSRVLPAVSGKGNGPRAASLTIRKSPPRGPTSGLCAGGYNLSPSRAFYRACIFLAHRIAHAQSRTGPRQSAPTQAEARPRSDILT
eukprot:4543364-Prymnesium_polylepis.1